MAVKFVEPVTAFDRIRYSAIELARRAYHIRGRMAYRERLRKVKTATAGEPRVSFGWIDDPSNSDDARIGGAVKLGHLRERFGESRTSFNVLYLVSSVIHLVPHVCELVSWAKRSGVRVVWNQNGVAYPAWCGARYPWFNEPMRQLIHVADHVVYQSAFCREAADRYLGVTNAPSDVFWNPVDLEHFSPGSSPAPGGTWKLLAMGTNHSFYRVKASIDCLAVLVKSGVDASLTIAGELRWRDGHEYVSRYLRERELDSRVTLLPRFTQGDAPAIYRGAHVLLHPKYKDPCPTVPIEAMACGLPVVGSNSGGMPELVCGGAGELVAVEDHWSRDVAPDPAAMADAVSRIMAEREQYSKAARTRAEEAFDRRTWLARHEEIFRTVLSNR